MSDESLRQVTAYVPSALAGGRLPIEPPGPWNVLVEIFDYDGDQHAQGTLEAGLDPSGGAPIQQAVIAKNLAEAERLWQLREAIPEAQARAGGNIKHDISLPLSSLAGFVGEVDQRLLREFEWAQPVVFGHLGDGNLHYNVGCRTGIDVERAFQHEDQINHIVYEAVHRCGGSFSAEHGIGQLKRQAAARYKEGVELEMMRAIKKALDPAGRMNPGKLL
jgi:FAD/FMN-containing dehydrogenase